MSKHQNPYTNAVLKKVLSSKNDLHVFFAKDIMRQNEPFAYLDEIIQRGFGKYNPSWIYSKSVTWEILLNNRKFVDDDLQKCIDTGEISKDYIILNDSITIIQFIYKKRCLEWYKKILRESGIL